MIRETQTRYLKYEQNLAAGKRPQVSDTAFVQFIRVLLQH